MSVYLGDYAEDYPTLNFKFTTMTAAEVPTIFAGGPAIKVYIANETGTELSTGVTLSIDFDGVTGLNNVLIDLSAAAAYAIGKDYMIVVTTGTVNGVSWVGRVLAHFSIENRFDNDLLALIQLLARKDFAISQDNSDQVTAINANGGSGAGTFLNTTDAIESLRDRGDQAWLTGGASGATKRYITSDWTRTIGDNDGGSGSDTGTVNGTYFSTGELNSGTYLEVDAVFTLDSETETALSVDFWGFYDGGGSHAIQVQALDTIGSVYEPIGTIGLSSTVMDYHFILSPQHTNSSTGVVTLKFLHQGGTGVASHVFSVDKCQVNSSVPSTTAAKLLSYMQILMRSDSGIATDRATELGEINTNEGNGAGDYSNQTEALEALRDQGDSAWITATAVESDLVKIHGTAITETATQLAGAFTKFFNVATPTGTTNSIPDAVAGAAGGLFIAGTNAETTVTTAINANIIGDITGDITGGLTGDITGNLSGSVGSVTGAVGSVTGAVGSIATGGIVAASFGAGAIDATAIKDAAIDNATFAADVGTTAYAGNRIAVAAGKTIAENNLDHLMKTAVANNADMSVEVPDGTVISNILSAMSTTSTYVVSTDSLEAMSVVLATVTTTSNERHEIETRTEVVDSG